jgi:hypothetical protein
MAQDRKVFVGGVPQDLNQDDLYAIFSEYAGVKKAWLQKCRASEDGSGTSNPPQNHRGFGFVIFHNPNAIEELLGGSPSRFIVLRSGAKLEVKRALSSSKMSGANSRTDTGQEMPPLVWPADGGRGQPPTQQVLQAAPEFVLRQRQVAQPQARLAPPWPSQASQINDGGSVLSQLSLMPNSTPTYPSGAGDLRAKAAGNNAQALVANTDLHGLTASDVAALSYGLIPSPVQPGAVLSHQGLICPPAPGHSGAPMPVVGEQRIGARQDATTKPSLRDAIVQFYQKHRPDKLSEPMFLESICSYYKDREESLDEALRDKYGEGLYTHVTSNAHQNAQAGAAAPPQKQAPPAAGGGTSAINGINQYLQFGAGRGQQHIDPMYVKQMNTEASYGLQTGLQTALPPMQALPQAPQQGSVPTTGNVGASGFAPGLPASNIFLGADLAGYVANAMACSTGTASNGGVSGADSTRSGNETGDDDVPVVCDGQSACLGDDEGFEISVEVAESIIGH